MIFFAVASWVIYTVLLISVLASGVRKRRVSLIAFATILLIILLRLNWPDIFWLSLQNVCMDFRLRLRGKRGVRRVPVQCVETIAGSCRVIW